MAYLSKEKDIVLRVINSILIMGIVVSLILLTATGIKIINKEKIGTYEEYAKEVCTIDKLEYECSDEDCIKDLDKERKKICTNYYLEDKKEKENINRSNRNNFLVFLGTTIVLFGALRLLNRKHK